MVEILQEEKVKKSKRSDSPKAKKGITVVLDAGIATDENLELPKSEEYDYVCVARNQPITHTGQNRSQNSKSAEK